MKLFGSLTDVLVLSLGLSLLIWYIQYLWNRRKFYTYCRKMKGPLSLPLIGSSYYFLQGNLEDVFLKILSLFNKYPGLAKFWHGQELMFLISDPEIAQVALTSPKAFSKSSLYRFLEDGLGHGLFTAPVQKWRKSRKHLLPTFSKQMLDGFQNTYIEYGEKLIQDINEIVEKGEKLDTYKTVKKNVLNILCETIMGFQLTGQSEDDFGYHIDRARNIGFVRIVNILYHNDLLFSFSKEYKELVESLDFLRNFVLNVIEQQRAVLNNNRENALLEADIEEGNKKRTFLQCLLEFPLEGCTTKDIQDEIFTFLSAGSDTTTNTICFALMLLAMYPEIEAKVYNEVNDILGTEREMQPEDIDKFVYIEQVLKETLRLFPAGPILGRTLEEDLQLKDGTILPENSTFLVGIMAIHRNEKYWKDPLKFDPDRFLPQNFSKQHPCTFMPFSYGPRNCIAHKFAMRTMKVLVANIVRRFHVKTNYKSVEDVDIFCGIVLQPQNGFNVDMVPRND